MASGNLNAAQRRSGSNNAGRLGHELGAVPQTQQVLRPNGTENGRAFPDESSLPFLEPIRSRFVSSDCAVAFARSLGVDLQIPDPPPIHPYAWKPNIRPELKLPIPSSIVRLVTQEDIHYYSSIYFEEIHPLYGFLDREAFFLQCEHLRGPNPPRRDFEAVLCGVIVLGSLFTHSVPCTVETQLAENARMILEMTVSQPGEYLSLYHVAGWILRTMYLRLTTRPHLSWITSCIMINIAESIGLHQEFMNLRLTTPHGPRMLSPEELELRRRTFWVAWSLNKFFSAEVGRSKAGLDNIGCRQFNPKAGDHTEDLIELAHMLPDFTPQGSDLSEMTRRNVVFDNLLKMPSNLPAIALLKTDVCFALYRRYRLSNVKMSKDQISTILTIAQEGLDQAIVLSKKKRPWWNLLSVPFQCICVLLSIDTRESLVMVNPALDVLVQLEEVYQTELGAESVSMARHLVKSSRQKKEFEMGLLEEPQKKEAVFDMSKADFVFPSTIEWPTEDLSGWALFFTGNTYL
ncbi:hypothetical protein BZG36_02556 [Bifiguratus adelaidae]|uniref:Xylanolytic transcriptional activator regulatory domain-containing protein n=1 Tax=Bifiguratus adelaidae TaxID=1938954 RepID=A0A261Y275_9FUNG|nr:hypothetical protein BZG36_02556 [Bifiguratus adelaidae]